MDSRRASVSLSTAALLVAGAIGWAVGCGSSKGSGFDATQSTRDASVGGGGEDGDLTFGGGDGATGGCVNLQCQIEKCPTPGVSTTVSGTVYDPAGKYPLYNVIVSIPNAPVDKFAEGVSCDRCGTTVSGSPVATALTGPDGKFVLKDVPSGTNIPLVMQIGKWRRQVTIPQVAGCVDTPMTDKGAMRLARNQQEGDIPRIAMVTGGCDHMECLLHNIGVDDAEFTAPTGPGRVHVYQGQSAGGPFDPKGATLHASTPAASTLWIDPVQMKKYDMIIDGCECAEVPNEKPQPTIDNHVTYVNSGGRLFAADYQYYWMAPQLSQPGTTSPWSSTATFQLASPGPVQDTATVDTSFPKGQAFADWLFGVGASPTKGSLPLEQAFYRASKVTPPSTRWLYGGTDKLFHYTFNAPVAAPDDQQCGKVVFSDFHVVGGVTGSTFPEECSSLPNAGAEQRALEFMLFDLSSCIQKDTDAPQPPPVN